MSELFNSGHAVIVGVGADLPNTVDDAEGLANFLKDEGRCAYPPEQVHLLTGPRATRDTVLAQLDELAKSTDEESTVVVYFSGHGYRIATSLDDFYFLMPYGYDVARLKTTAIKGDEFVAKLDAIPARKLLVLLDCCHAGGVGEAKAPYVEEMTKAPLPPEAVSLLVEGRGRVLVASSREDELSYAGRPYSKFTAALLEALSGMGVAKQDGYVRVADVALHARQVVPVRTNGRQHPILHFEHTDNFVLAYYAGGETEPKALPFDVEPEAVPAAPVQTAPQVPAAPGGPVSPADLRKQLQRLDDTDIETLCLDHFPMVYDKFARGLRRDEMINLLLGHCRRNPEEAKKLSGLLHAQAF